MNELAPVVIFAYRRPDHLRNTLASLMRCDGFDVSPIIVYCDGPRNQADVDAVCATRAVARELLGDRAEYHFRDVNLGLSSSVIAGVGETLARFGRVIVVEDDLEVSPSILTYMNRALKYYADDERVFQVSGYMYDLPGPRSDNAAFFLPVTVSWGWATWKRAWDQFNPNATGWEAMQTDQGLRQRFNLDGAYDYATMLERQMQGLRDSWAIRWYWSVFSAGGLVLFPPVSLVSNTGFDGSGTHGRGCLRRFSKTVAADPASRIDLPERVCIDTALLGCVKKALWRKNGGWAAPLVDRIKRMVKI